MGERERERELKSDSLPRHGAFAVEYVRTAVEVGAASVTLVCRRRTGSCIDRKRSDGFGTSPKFGMEYLKPTLARHVCIWKYHC